MHVSLRWAGALLSLSFVYTLPAEKKRVLPKVVELKPMFSQKEDSETKVLAALPQVDNDVWHTHVAANKLRMKRLAILKKGKSKSEQELHDFKVMICSLEESLPKLPKAGCAQKTLDNIFAFIPDIRWLLVNKLCLKRFEMPATQKYKIPHYPKQYFQRVPLTSFVWKNTRQGKEIVPFDLCRPDSTQVAEDDMPKLPLIDKGRLGEPGSRVPQAVHPHKICSALACYSLSRKVGHCMAHYTKGMVIAGNDHQEATAIEACNELMAFNTSFLAQWQSGAPLLGTSFIAWNPEGTLLGATDWEGQFILWAPGVTKAGFAKRIRAAAQRDVQQEYTEYLKANIVLGINIRHDHFK